MISALNKSAKSVGAAVSLAAAALNPLPAEAVLMPEGADDQAYKDFGVSFAQDNKAMWFKMTSTDGVGIATLTPLNPYYGITSAHAVTGSFENSTFTFGTGLNFNMPSSSYSVSEVLVYPGYDGTRNGPDIAIVKFATPIFSIEPVTIGSASPGEVVSAAGYGFAFRVGDLIPTSRDGFIRAWNAPVTSGSPSQSSDLYYDRTLFGSSGGFMNGKLLSGDSGGPVYNQLGQLVGLNTAQSGGADPVGTSIYLQIAQPDVHNWIQANTSIPEPSTVALLGLGALGAYAFSRRSKQS